MAAPFIADHRGREGAPARNHASTSALSHRGNRPSPITIDAGHRARVSRLRQVLVPMLSNLAHPSASSPTATLSSSDLAIRRSSMTVSCWVASGAIPASDSGVVLTVRNLWQESRGRQGGGARPHIRLRSEEHTSELQSRLHLVCRLLLEK